MTTISQARSPTRNSRPSGGLLRRIGDLGALPCRAIWVRRAAIKTLRQLDDRALRDIGIPRSHIEAAVWGTSILTRAAAAKAHADPAMRKSARSIDRAAS